LPLDILVQSGDHDDVVPVGNSILLATDIESGDAAAVCTENFIRVDDAPESPKLAE
jgi:hypothetical protein